MCTPDELFSDNDADITVCEDKGVVCEVKDTFIDALFEGNCSLHQSKDTLCDDLIPDNSISKEIPDDSSPSNITKPGNKTFSANAVSQNSGSGKAEKSNVLAVAQEILVADKGSCTQVQDISHIIGDKPRKISGISVKMISTVPDSLTGEKRKLELPTPDFSSSAVSNDLPATQV